MPHLLHLTLQKAVSINTAVAGSFTESRQNEIVASHGKCLALYRITDDAKIQEVFHEEAFGLIRALSAFRLTGGNKDYLAVTSDSGRIVILDWDGKKFVRLHKDTYGKTGIRRAVAGNYLAVDPKGRSLMIAATEKQKFAYILNRDPTGRLALGSPLEAHKSYQICFGLCSLNVGYENPVFASLEVNYESLDQPTAKPVTKTPVKQLVFWELDLGLNHVVRKCVIPCDATASCIIPVPAGVDFSEGPGGVIVCGENFVVFKKPDHPERVCRIPRRLEIDEGHGIIIASWVAHRMKDFWFVLLQSELGDIYRLDLNSKLGDVESLVMRYYDTIPVASALCILKSGYLFAASEMGDHALYQFIGIGSDDEEVIGTADGTVPFRPCALRNLMLVDEMPSMGPMTDLKAIDCIGDNQCPQIYALSGSGSRGYLNILRSGLAVEEMAASELPGYPTGLWTLAENFEDEYHRYILLSFSSATLVLKISDAIEEQHDSLFITNRSTVYAACMKDNSHLQVYEDGWKRIAKPENPEGESSVTLWKTPGGKRIIAATSNGNQLVLSISTGIIVYFNLQNNDLTHIAQTDSGFEVNCIAIQPTPPYKLKSNYIAIGSLDRSIRILSIENDQPFKLLHTLQLSPDNTHPESIAICKLPFSYLQASSQTNTLLVGLSNGTLLRTIIDPLTGSINTNRRMKLLGSHPCKCIPINNQNCLILSSKPWLAYSHENNFRLSTLIYDTIHFAATLKSVHCVSGFVAVSGNVLKIISTTINPQDKLFSSTKIPLNYTPRKATVFPPPPTSEERQNARLQGMPIMLLPPSQQRPWLIATIEGDHNAYDLTTKEEIAKALNSVELEQDKNEEKQKLDPPLETQIGSFSAGEGKWGGCLRLISPSPPEILQTIPFGPDEVPTSITVCQFLEYPQHPALVVGVVTALNLKSRRCQIGHLRVYVYDQKGQLSLYHETPVEDIPLALCPWSGQLLAAIGHRIRLYTLGKKRLLKRCEYKNLPTGVNWLRVSGDRIFASDIREGFHVLKYSAVENVLQVTGDMTVPRWVVCGEVLDAHTIVGGDKFDNVFVVRLPPGTLKDSELYDTTGLKVRGDTPYLTGQCNKLDRICEFHVGDMPIAMQKCLLAPGGSEIILFGTVLGGLGALLPLQTQKEVEMLQHLEMLMRNEDLSLVARDHTFFRSAYFPVKKVIDGDLLELYPKLRSERQTWIAQQIDKAPADVQRLLDDVRSRII